MEENRQIFVGRFLPKYVENTIKIHNMAKLCWNHVKQMWRYGLKLFVLLGALYFEPKIGGYTSFSNIKYLIWNKKCYSAAFCLNPPFFCHLFPPATGCWELESGSGGINLSGDWLPRITRLYQISIWENNGLREKQNLEPRSGEE